MNARRRSYNNNNVVAVDNVAHSPAFRQCLIVVHDMIQFARSHKEINITDLSIQSISCSLGLSRCSYK